MRGKTMIERALELAATGRFGTVTQIKAELRKERYDLIDSGLAGRGIRDQLKILMRASKDAAEKSEV